MPPGGEPRAVERGVVAGPHGRDAGAVEPERERALLQPRGEVRSDAFHQTGWYPPRSPPCPARGPARARGLTPSSFHRGLTRTTQRPTIPRAFETTAAAGPGLPRPCPRPRPGPLKTMLIRVAHSPDSDDAFMFYALARGLVDTGARQTVPEHPDTETRHRR